MFGTLISVREGSYAAFHRILSDAGATSGVDVKAFWETWEERNIEAYWGAYRPYRQICEESLASTFERFGITRGRPECISYYFDAFPEFELYPDVLETLELLSRRFKLAIVSNIDDDLLAATPLQRTFDLVCTAERAKGYKPDGTLFRYLLANAGVPSGDLHSGESQFTDLVGAKPLGVTVAWINRRNVPLDANVLVPTFNCPISGPWLRRGSRGARMTHPTIPKSLVVAVGGNATHPGGDSRHGRRAEDHRRTHRAARCCRWRCSTTSW